MVNWDNLNRQLTRYGDLILVTGVICILAILVVRVPPTVIDYLIATNISVAVIALLVALYTPEAVRLPSLPTVLLLTTLFRLALNVSTTRLILLDADAGEIIYAFGDFVVGGNFVVGAVVFLVLVLIQFIVIAKGSERVAEVAAKFTLDAMPGKQMSIDADLRNGIIDEAQAKTLRATMDRESRLFGAMDGAMKFVKGDAIAGIVISTVNIIGGLIVGVLQMGMELGEAAQVYSLLTIGDGLVSQIPALLISVSAGIVITRVAEADDPEHSHLAGDILNQVLARPRALKFAGGLMFVFGLSHWWTGFPLLPFVLLGGIAFGLGVMRRKVDDAAADAAERPAEDGAAAEPQAAARGYAPRPLEIRLHPDLEPLVAPLTPQLVELRHLLSERFGLDFPAAHFVVDPRLAANEYQILAYDGLIGRGMLDGSKAWVLQLEKAFEHRLEPEPAELPGTRLQVARIDRSRVDEARRHDLTVYEPGEVLLRHVRLAQEQNAADFLGVQAVQRMLDALHEPSLVQSVMPKQFQLQDITRVLKLLLAEQVPIRDLRHILESMAHLRIDDKHRDPSLVVEYVRRDLRKALCTHLAARAPGNRLYCYRFSREIEDLLENDAWGRDVLGFDTKRDIREAIRNSVDPRLHLAAPAVLLVKPSIRAATRRLIEGLLPEVSVLSEQEIWLQTRTQVQGSIALQAG